MQDILVVDDEALIRKGLKKIIELPARGFQVLGEAASGSEGLDKLAERPFHTVITDIKMPGMDGVEFVKRIHVLYPDMNIIVLSGYKDFEFVKETMKHGAVDYLLKPVENEELIDLLTKIDEKSGVRAPKIESVYKKMDKKLSNPVETAIRFIETNFDKEVSLSEIANLVHLNSVYFSQLFKRETGHNFTQYLIGHRIEKAKELLHDGNNRVSEISFRVGYEDSNYFSRIFKKVTGLSPYEYRLKCGVANEKTPD